MNKITIVLIVLLSNINVFGQGDIQYSQNINKAVESYKVQNYKLSVDYFEKAFEINNQKAIDLFNGACSAALNGDTLKAFDFLDLSIKNGYLDLKHIEKDCDLYSLRTLPQWEEVIGRVKENEENYLSSDKVLKSIIESFESNNPEQFWNICSDTYKKNQNKDSVFALVNNFHKVLDKYNFEFKDLSKSESSSTNYKKINLNFSSWDKDETRELNYTLTPKIIGEYTKDYFIKGIGYNINVKLKPQGNKWALYDIIIKNNYFKDSFDCQRHISEYFDDTCSVTCQMGVVTANKQIVCLSTYIASDILFGKMIQTLEWKDFNDIPINDKPIIYKMYFVKKTSKQKKKSDNIFDSFFQPSVSYEYLEIVFLDKSDNLIISNGEMYGIYEGDNSKMKKWILGELSKIE
ncbi:hypothetical protein [Mariniflexile sp. HMF6888]|uniref:hypothetical protein n=1 Tax=Mariniflexile sp. HMF6888 TaxID=3373086 RepID=UPI00378879D2